MLLLAFISFITIASVIWLGGHYYLAIRISDISDGKIPAYLVKTAVFAGALLFLAAELLTRLDYLQKHSIPSSILREISIVGLVWGGIFSVGITVFLIRDLILLTVPPLRCFNQISGIISIGIIVFLSAVALWRGTRQPAVAEYNLMSPKLPRGTNFSVVQLSDLHINYAKSPSEWLEKIIDTVNQLNADAVVITGDIIDIGNLCNEGADYCKALKKIKARYGIYAVSGNHEYYAGYDNFRKFADEANIKILENENVFIPLIPLKEAGSSSEKKHSPNSRQGVIIAGIPDDEATRFGGKNSAPDFEKAIRGADTAGNYSILLAHRPTNFENHRSGGIDLQLSGHLHAGQIPPMDLIIYLSFRYPYGLFRRGSSLIYTTSGTSTWGPPMRLFSKNEIVKFNIRPVPLQ